MLLIGEVDYFTRRKKKKDWDQSKIVRMVSDSRVVRVIAIYEGMEICWR